MPNYDYSCPECKEAFVLFSSYGDRDQNRPCPGCGGEYLTRFYGKFPGVNRASHPDGRKTEANQDLKEATKLEIESYDLPREKRGPINDAINNLKSTKSARVKRKK
jgi:putative FmdB family regulatory protein